MSGNDSTEPESQPRPLSPVVILAFPAGIAVVRALAYTLLPEGLGGRLLPCGAFASLITFAPFAVLLRSHRKPTTTRREARRRTALAVAATASTVLLFPEFLVVAPSRSGDANIGFALYVMLAHPVIGLILTGLVALIVGSIQDEDVPPRNND